jgi:septum formation protein
MLLVLASTSPFRQALLQRLDVPFETFNPNVDESAQLNEKPEDLVQRLAVLKAQAAQSSYPDALIIGSDQVAVVENKILGKPLTHDKAVEQLTFLSGKKVVFQTGLCVFNSKTKETLVDLISFTVKFRELELKKIKNYLRKEPAYNCAGSFKSEGLGIALVESMEGNDPNALIGLPLIRLIQMLEHFDLSVI